MGAVFKTSVVAGATLMFASAGAFAASIVYLGPINQDTGLGHGNVLEVLDLKTNATSEAGSVRWGDLGVDKKGNPLGYGDIYNDIPTGDFGSDAQAQGKTRTVAELGVTRDTFGVVFNINEADQVKQLKVREFTLYFQNSDGTSVFGTASFTSTDPSGDIFANLGGGQGQGDHLFQAKFTAADTWIDSWLAGSTNRLGMYARLSKALTDVSDGADTFSAGPITSFGPTPVPLPASFWFGGAGLAGMIAWQVLGRRK